MSWQGGLNFRRGQLSRLVPVVEHCLALGGHGYVRWEREDDALTRMHCELAALRQVGDELLQLCACEPSFYGAMKAGAVYEDTLLSRTGKLQVMEFCQGEIEIPSLEVTAIFTARSVKKDGRLGASSRIGVCGQVDLEAREIYWYERHSDQVVTHRTRLVKALKDN